MTVEELLKPRYKVIADYPGSAFKIGELVQPHPKYGFDIFPYPEKYPHLFKPLAWYEEREVSDMPGYVKVNPDLWDHSLDRVEKVKSWTGCGQVVEFESGKEGHSDYWIPANKKEYQDYLKTKA